jgi:hypothetical protein
MYCNFYTGHTDTPTIALVKGKFNEKFHVIGTVPVSLHKCKSHKKLFKKGKPNVKKPPAVKNIFKLYSC